MSMFDPTSPNFDSSLFPNQDNGLVQLVGLEGISTPLGTDLSENQGPRIVAASSALMVLSLIAVSLRFLARRLSRVQLWWDDWTILLAMFMAWGSCICMILAATQKWFGRHAEYYPSLFERVFVAQSYLKLFYAYQILYTFAVALCKYSILLFYGRIFSERPFRIALYIMYTLITLWLVAIGITVFAECLPVTGLWQLNQPAKCINLISFFVGSGIPNVLLNIVIVFLPIPMVWTLDIERKHRIALSGVFGLGSFVIAVSIVRVVILANVSLTDITWNFVDAGIWTSVEPSIAVVSACLPVLRSLWVWNSRRYSRKSTNTMQTKTRSPRQSFHDQPPPVPKGYRTTKSYTPKSEKKNRHDSLSKPINEFITELDGQWGVTTTDIYSNTPSRAASHRKLRLDDRDMKMQDLPIQRQDYSVEKSLANHNRSSPSIRPQMKEKSDNVAELYGS